MQSSVRIVSSLTLAALLLPACKKHTPPPSTSRFHTGEVWSFHTPTNLPPGGILRIARIDMDPEVGPIIYVSVSGVPRRKTQQHLFFPFSEDALNRSVIALTTTNSPWSASDESDFQYFYDTHVENIDSGQLGKCFTTTVTEVLTASAN